MKTFFSCLAGLCTLAATTASGQPSRTLTWGTSFTPAWADGATTGSAINVDGSSTSIYVNITKTSGTWVRSLYTSGNMTPSKNGSYNVGLLAPPNNLMLALDFPSLTDYITVEIIFSHPVYKVAFAIGDIDRHLKNRNDFMDEVVVEANYKTVHPTFSKYMTDPLFPNQLVFSGDTVRVNPNGALSGNAGPLGYPGSFDAAEQAGTVNIDYGTKLINSIRIRYGSAKGSIPDPTVQAIAIGNISFKEALQALPTAPVFSAQKVKDGVALQWDAPNETAGTTYGVECSHDGTNFTEVANLAAQNKGAEAHYNYLHQQAPAGMVYYRLKTTQADGTSAYSPVVTVKGAGNGFSINKIYPSLFASQLTLQAEVPEAGNAYLTTYNLKGELITRTQYAVAKGTNSLPVKTPEGMAPGTYVFCLRYNEETQTAKAIKL